MQDIVLAPLAYEDLGRLIADSLHCDFERAAPLAQLIHDKTAGNPFFAIQFFSALAEDSFLTFDYGERRWSSDLNRIHAKGYTDNVVDLMAGKLNRLSIETQKALQLLACVGNSVDFTLLPIVTEESIGEVHRDLWEAVRAGLVVRAEASYRFVHDRIQESAYFLISEPSRAERHLRIEKTAGGEHASTATPPSRPRALRARMTTADPQSVITLLEGQDHPTLADRDRKNTTVPRLPCSRSGAQLCGVG